MLKARFLILNLMPNFKQSRLCYVIVVCCALHNFICINNRSDELFTTWRDDTQSEGRDSKSKGNGNGNGNGNGIEPGNTRASTNSTTQRHVMEMSNEAKRLIAQFRDDITIAM